MTPGIVPELDVKDLNLSVAFYVTVLGFRIRYDRPEERFVYLEREAAELMLEEAAGPGRRFRTAPLAHPYGRGVNFQIRCSDVAALERRVAAAGSAFIVPLETRWYRAGDLELGNRQFVVADPDGYLLRFFEDLGPRPAD
jgi:catechol 2,3-dioxygenase-like lactoylglutathione lyase family enzyme